MKASEASVVSEILDRVRMTILLALFFVPIIAAVWVQRANRQMHELGLPLPSLSQRQYDQTP
jgi:hypothetical protein